jgi:hypothetical protein
MNQRVMIAAGCTLLGGVVGYFIGRYQDKITEFFIGSPVKNPQMVAFPSNAPLKKEKENYKGFVENIGYINNTEQDATAKFSSTTDSLAQLIKEVKESDGPMEEDLKDPYLIDISEYGFKSGFEEKTLSYFQIDDTLIDDNEEIVQVDDTIGRECLDAFLSTDPDDIICTFYVRNEKIGVDYEVIWQNKPYYDVWIEGDNEEI